MESSSRHIEATSEVDVPPRSWARILSAAEAICGKLFPESSVALHFVSDSAIRRLNREYRCVDRATDVLSFPPHDPDTDLAARGRGTLTAAGQHAGDIAVSWETAQRQAQINGNSSEDECIALVTHGLLHLAGYEHETEAADALMQQRAIELLEQVGVYTKVYGH